MYGNVLSKSLRVIGYMIASPRDGARWVRDRVYPRSPLQLGVPWVSYSAIDWLQRNVSPGQQVFEWGGGGSTVFFLRRRCVVTTVETDECWKAALEEAIRLSHSFQNHELRFIPIELNGKLPKEAYVETVDNGAPWDIIVVDGVEDDIVTRVNCVQAAAEALRPGGLIILDDAWRREYADAQHILEGWERRIFRGLGPARWGVTQTDIYVAPARY